jgi:hypothetical protein
MSRIPQFSTARGLSLPEQYAAVELLRGTMARHSVIVSHQDAVGARQLSLADNAFLGYVPIRLPDTICVQENLPAGAVAVLVNRNHTYSDLYMPINAQQKRMFFAIDGERTVAQIVGGSTSTELARTFFERLWWMDQVVFDAHTR